MKGCYCRRLRVGGGVCFRGFCGLFLFVFLKLRLLNIRVQRPCPRMPTVRPIESAAYDMDLLAAFLAYPYQYGSGVFVNLYANLCARMGAVR